MEFRPFTIDVSQSVLDDLAERLARTRWPNEPRPSGDAPDPLAEQRRLLAYWAEGYDWPAVQARLNRWDHRTTRIDGRDVHLVHERSQQPGAVPLLLLHGWPDSFYRYAHVIDRLTGRDRADDGAGTFDVVVPSLPGYVFSDQPEPGGATVAAAARVIAELMAGLGYDRYLVHGGDWGSAVAEEIARTHPDRVIGMHLLDVPFPNIFAVDRATASEAEIAYLDRAIAWSESAVYFTVQGGAPLELAHGLADSPAGLAGWLADKFQAWSQARLTDDDVLTNVMLYWVTNTIRSSFRFYSEGLGNDWEDDAAGSGDADASSWSEGAGDWSPRIEVPTAIAHFPADIGGPAPREYAERFFDVRRHTVMPRGGHFAALEEPDLLVDDLRAFAAELATARD